MAWLASLAGLVIATLLLLTGLLSAALLAGLIALLLLARLLVGVLVLLVHSVFLQRCWLLWLEDCLRDFPANKITSDEIFRSVCNGMREPFGNLPSSILVNNAEWRTTIMGRYLLLWLLGVPLPILALIWIFGGLH